MYVLNATTKVKSIMVDNGDLITIMPGALSEVIIATRNIIRAAINMGSPSEIGVIICGSYEMDIAKDITGAVPYLYSDVDEAKSKLIDPSIDYKKNLSTSVEVAGLDLKYKEAQDTIKNLESEIAELKTQLEQDHPDTTALKELRVTYAQLESKFKELGVEKGRCESTIKDLEFNISDLTNKLNDSRKTCGRLEQENSNLMSNASASESLKNDLDELTSKNEELEEKVEKLKEALSDSEGTIKSMTDTFNTACKKFNIRKDENGEWVQLTD